MNLICGTAVCIVAALLGAPRTQWVSYDFEGSTVKASKSQLPARLNKDAIRNSIIQAEPFIAACYATELGRDPQAQGKLALQFVIGPSGQVLKAQFNWSTMGNRPLLEGCILGLVKALSFPPPGEGVNVRVGYPIELVPQ